jgi:outer membrane protein assembly factor BamB
MYQGDEAHTGAARGCSSITSTTVGRMTLFRKVPVDGPINTIPVVVDGKVYVGTTRFSETGGRLYKIDLLTGTVEATFTPTGTAFYPISGIGGSPAVVGGRVYISTVYGQVYCLDAATLGLIWMQDLKVAGAARRQPINNPDGDCWPSPLVVNGRVYVASGEGESETPFGFVWCLDAATGLVVWVYCTSKFVDPDAAGNENKPNVIPRSAAVSDPLPAWATAAGFSLHDDPPHKGSAPWSSCAYDRVLDRIYIGTGNSLPYDPLPDNRYASGVIALDATTGEFRGFHQPLQSDSYRPNDLDIDVPCPPTVFERDGTRVMAYGSKNGSFFLCDADTMEVLPNGRRQLLPKDEATGGRIHTVDPTGRDIPTQDEWAGENRWGVMASAAVDRERGQLYVGLGGYGGIDDPAVTPFVRALDWNDLSDAWPTTVQSVTTGGITYSVRKYANATPPVYTSREAGLGSPAVCNDVVFVPSHKVGLYAMDTQTGLCLWSAPGLPTGGWPNYCMGPAVYGDSVVVGAGDGVYLYRLRPRRPLVPALERPAVPVTPPAPAPVATPDLLAAVRDVVRQELAARDIEKEARQ